MATIETETPALHPADPLPPAFNAWRRKQGGRWRIVASGASESEAFGRMLEATRGEGPGHAATVVLPAGEQPS